MCGQVNTDLKHFLLRTFEENALSPLLFVSALGYAIKAVKVN